MIIEIYANIIPCVGKKGQLRRYCLAVHNTDIFDEWSEIMCCRCTTVYVLNAVAVMHLSLFVCFHVRISLKGFVKSSKALSVM